MDFKKALQDYTKFLDKNGYLKEVPKNITEDYLSNNEHLISDSSQVAVCSAPNHVLPCSYESKKTCTRSGFCAFKR